MSDGSQERLHRRDYLVATASVGFGGLAGCSGGDDTDQEDKDTPGNTSEQSPEDTPTETPTPEPTPEETPTPEDDPTQPEFESQTVEPANAAGEVAYDLQITADTIIEELHVDTETASIEELPGRQSVDISGTIEAVPGEINDVSITAYTDDGGEQTRKEECYTRKYDPADLDSDLEFPPMYMLFWDGGISKTFEECAVGMPEVGPYSQFTGDFDRDNWEAFETHFDQMQGHGIDSVWMVVGHNELEVDALEETYRGEVALFDDMDVYLKYPISAGGAETFEDKDIIGDLEWMAEFIEDSDNIGTIDDRPVVGFWRANSLHREEYHEIVKDRFDSLQGLFNEIRETLTIDGTEPFIVGNIGGVGHRYATGGQLPDDLLDMIRSFDGIHNGYVSLNEREDEDNVEYFRETTKEFIKNTSEFADEFNLEFIPNVHTGFDTRENHCWPMQRYFGRSPEMFEEFLDLAIEHRTTELVHIWSWNEWAEGHMIEPGTWQGEDFEEVDYGTTYLEILEEKKQS